MHEREIRLSRERADMTDKCDACGKPIKADSAFIVAHTSTTSQRWHLGCCPWLKPHPEQAQPAVGVTHT
jgi:hypothetical protein